VITLATAERDAVIVACAISAGVHAALVPEHLAEGRALGIGFAGTAAFLALLAAVLTREASPVALTLAAALFAGLIGSYLLAVTFGLPLLHPEVEPLTGLAVATKAVEAAGLAAAVHLVMRGRPSHSVSLSPKGALQ
jgi:hypothetical protein